MGTWHAQTYVKVNVPVDEGVAPLVEALSTIDGVTTVDSCEDDDRGHAYVLFTRGPGDLALFLADMSRRLGGRVRDFFFLLALEWAAGGTEPLARLTCPHGRVNELADALRSSYERP